MPPRQRKMIAARHERLRRYATGCYAATYTQRDATARYAAFIDIAPTRATRAQPRCGAMLALRWRDTRQRERVCDARATRSCHHYQRIAQTMRACALRVHALRQFYALSLTLRVLCSARRDECRYARQR